MLILQCWKLFAHNFFLELSGSAQQFCFFRRYTDLACHIAHIIVMHTAMSWGYVQLQLLVQKYYWNVILTCNAHNTASHKLKVNTTARWGWAMYDPPSNDWVLVTRALDRSWIVNTDIMLKCVPNSGKMQRLLSWWIQSWNVYLSCQPGLRMFHCRYLSISLYCVCKHSLCIIFVLILC